MTAFRDEHEGLRAQIRELESEVKELRRQLRIARDADVAAMQRKVEAAEAKVRDFEKGGARRTYMMFGGGVGFFIGIGAGMYLASVWGVVVTQGSYRDETEALRAKVASLETRLEAAEREPHRLEPKLRKKRIKALEAQVAELEAKNRSLEEQLSKGVQGSSPKSSLRLGIAIGFFLGGCAAVLASLGGWGA